MFWKDVAIVSRINQNVQRNSSTPEGQIKVCTADWSVGPLQDALPTTDAG
jgi:hypothetical protein